MTSKSIVRPSWDSYFMEIAETTATRATCSRAKHGCVLVKDNTILSTGYNGSPPNCPHCTEVGCLMLHGHCVACNHAEMNAICRAAISGISTTGAKAYITGEPCLLCIRMLLCAGIKEIIYKIKGHYAFPPEEEQIRQYFLTHSGILYKGI